MARAEIGSALTTLTRARSGTSTYPAVAALKTLAADCRAILAPLDAGATSVRVAAPALTTADARALRVREVIGSFMTPYPCCQPRVRNIRRAEPEATLMRVPADYAKTGLPKARTPKDGKESRDSKEG
mgnify:CR=1 FL=1